ncbi:hypothetical protein Tco_1568821 [Tanacetum coccineum]
MKIDGRTKKVLFHAWMNGNWNKRRIDDSILRSNNATTDSFLKPYLITHGKSDTEKEDEQSQTKRKYSNTSNSIDEQPNKRRYKAEKFEVIRYSLGPNDEYIAIRGYEFDIWERNEDNLFIIYQDIFQKKDEGWKVGRNLHIANGNVYYSQKSRIFATIAINGTSEERRIIEGIIRNYYDREDGETTPSIMLVLRNEMPDFNLLSDQEYSKEKVAEGNNAENYGAILSKKDPEEDMSNSTQDDSSQKKQIVNHSYQNGRTFSVMTDFVVLENMDDYRVEGMSDVIFGGPFLREVGIKTRRFEGMITIYNGNDEDLVKEISTNIGGEFTNLDILKCWSLETSMA